MLNIRKIGLITLLLALTTITHAPDTNIPIAMSGIAFASDEEQTYLDAAGLEALRLWDEREKDRTVSNYYRQNWDYPFYLPTRCRTDHPYQLLPGRYREYPQHPAELFVVMPISPSVSNFQSYLIYPDTEHRSAYQTKARGCQPGFPRKRFHK